jgi:hypothetical protein
MRTMDQGRSGVSCDPSSGDAAGAGFNGAVVFVDCIKELPRRCSCAHSAWNARNAPPLKLHPRAALRQREGR